MKKKIALAFLAFGSCAVAAGLAIPNDPYFSRQWALANDGTQTISIDKSDLETLSQKGVSGVDIGWQGSRELVRTLATHKVTVAVIDYGIDPSHPDLQGRISADGWDFISNSKILMDDRGHGTHVSGIIAANSDNKVGIAGITPSTVQILPLRILSDDFNNFSYKGKLLSHYAADAIRYATDHHADVINMSLGWPKLVDNKNVRDAVQAALAKGIVIVASAGNDHKQQPTYPCSYEGVICVGAISNNGELSLYSNWGGKVDVLAPGDYILSTFSTTVESGSLRIPGYDILSGTSQSAPMISAMAAVLRSINPAMPASEVEARILAASRAAPVYQNIESALYGLPSLLKIAQMISTKPQPVYLPNFKEIEDLIVDENSLRLSSSLTLKNLWADGTNVNVQVNVNGKAAGSISVANFAGGSSIQVPWQYQFSSLEESADLTIVLQVKDDQGSHKSFTANMTASRSMKDVAAPALRLNKATSNTSDWIGTNIVGALYAKMGPVPVYGQAGSPCYYRLVKGSPQGLDLEILDSSEPNSPLRKANVPGIAQISQVFRVALNGEGKLDWIVTGLGKDEKGITFFQFFVMDENLQPMGQNPSQRIYSPNSQLGKLIPRSYSNPGSWIRGPSGLLPCFTDIGPLPPQDNFDSLDPRHDDLAQHLYYLEADPAQKAKAGVQILRLRAVDGKSLQLKYPQSSIVQPLPQSADDTAKGVRRFIFGSTNDLTATMKIMTVTSVTDLSFKDSAWSRLNTIGDRVMAAGTPNDTSMTYVAYQDGGNGLMSWTNSQGDIKGTAQFVYQEIGDPLTGKMISANLMPNQDRYWFLQSQFHVVAFYQRQNGTTINMNLPIDRDSSFDTETFNLIFSPAIVGSEKNPLPGVFVDSTQIVGHRINVITANLQTGKLERRLRYSLNVPDGCLNMQPVQLNQNVTSFAVPLLCGGDNAATALSLKLIQPNLN